VSFQPGLSRGGVDRRGAYVSGTSLLLEQPKRDLGTTELWERSLTRSRERRIKVAAGEPGPRSLISSAIPDLDGPLTPWVGAGSTSRDLSEEELWSYSQAIAEAKRRAAEKGVLPQARLAGASLVVAAVAAALPAPGGALARARSNGVTQEHVSLLRLGSRGPAVARVQRALGILVDGVFGQKTRGAVKGFQRSHGLRADGIVGPATRSALFDDSGSNGLTRAWWVTPVQRTLGVQADGIFGPVTRAAVRSYQASHGLVADGIVGPRTLASLKISRHRSGTRGGRHHYIRAWWVVPVQRALNLPPDGLYGPQTRLAVRRFQARRGLAVDGVVGPQTLRALGIERSGGTGPSGTVASGRGARVAAMATRYLGIPYRWGGASPSTGFDCSGFVMYLYGKVGVSLPHNAAAQYRYGRPVSRSNLVPGDIVFFDGLGHDGIYLGGGRFIHSPHSGDVVKISSLNESWYSSRWVGARRI
jgi:peptidoglycan DL-endopeptidase CwlO